MKPFIRAFLSLIWKQQLDDDLFMLGNHILTYLPQTSSLTSTSPFPFLLVRCAAKREVDVFQFPKAANEAEVT